MEEQNFLTKSELFLQNLADNIEDADTEAVLSVEFHDGILEIIDDNDKTYVINQHSATQKIWYSSPYSGADYFSYQQDKWCNKNQLELKTKLAAELKNFYTITINV
jgi:iron donor protein CyaY